MADDVGITKARFIQINDSTYVLEADISRSLIGAIGTPDFPAGFQVSKPSFSDETSWIIITYRIYGSKELYQNDEIYLPWGRTGVDLTVQWQDGQIFQGLFLNKGRGIYIPISEIRKSEYSIVETVNRQLVLALQHFPKGIIHLLLPLVLVLGWGRELLRLEYGAMTLAGIGGGLFLFEMGMAGSGLLFAHILEIICILLLSYYLLKQKKVLNLSWFILTVVAVHTLGWAHFIQKDTSYSEQLIWAIFIAELLLRILQILLVILFLLIFSTLRSKPLRQGLLHVCAAFTVAFLLWSYTSGVEKDNQRKRQASSDILVAANSVVKPQMTRGALELTKPIMAYYAVEPYEVRAEILVNARAGVRILGVDDKGKGAIPISSQQKLKDYLLAKFEESNSLKIDGALAQTVASSINFVSLTPTGVLLREQPQPESLDEGVLGITLIYNAEELADQLELQWNIFAEELNEVEISITDPFGISTRIISPEETIFSWESRLPGYNPPQIEKIEVRIPGYSLLSLVLLVSALLLFGLKSTRNTKQWRSVAFTLLAMAVLVYPLIRTEIRLPFVQLVDADKAETEQLMEDLIGNVYRAFDVRDEGAVYDRLAISVTGEQLNRIYLENRKSMELEERGGARAHVDEVIINEVANIEEYDGNYMADVAWNVGGSVSHFGHTHYRRNSYLARVSFQIVEGSWKITDIELLDEERIL